LFILQRVGLIAIFNDGFYLCPLMGWTGRVLHFSSNTGAVNTERNMIMKKPTSPAAIATIVINTWLKQNNHIRPHQSLNMRPPVPETLQQGGTENWD